MKTLATSLTFLCFVAAQAKETISLQGYDKWIAEEFDGVTVQASQYLTTADPDGDGLSNLLEYALESDPLFPSEHALPRAHRTQSHLVFTYDEDRSKTDIRYRAQISPDLRQWTDAETTVIVSKGSIERRRLAVPTDTEPLFVRLEVTLAESRAMD